MNQTFIDHDIVLFNALHDLGTTEQNGRCHLKIWIFH